MKDFTGTELQEGDIVVVKPSSRDTAMRFGFVKKVNANSAAVRSFAATRWYQEQAEFISGNFQSPSIYLVKSRKCIRFDHNFPEGFPEELKGEYFTQFSDFPKTDTV